MVEKTPEAFRNISEVSLMLDIPTHVLRFWETRFSQLKPVKRNGGRRYYRPEDIVLLKRIQNLLYDEGYTIKGAQQVLRNYAKPKEKEAVKALHHGQEGQGQEGQEQGSQEQGGLISAKPADAGASAEATGAATADIERAVVILKKAKASLAKLG